MQKDLGSIKDLWVEFIDFHQERDPLFARSSDGSEHFLKFVLGNMTSPDWLVLVAEEAGQIIGYGMATIQEYPPVYLDRRYGYIQDVAITEERRGRGVGARLYREMISWFEARDIRRVELDVAVSNEVSRAFWTKMGFRDFMKRQVKSI